MFAATVEATSSRDVSPSVMVGNIPWRFLLFPGAVSSHYFCLYEWGTLAVSTNYAYHGGMMGISLPIVSLLAGTAHERKGDYFFAVFLDIDKDNFTPPVNWEAFILCKITLICHKDRKYSHSRSMHVLIAILAERSTSLSLLLLNFFYST